jgi:hypothetical protein
MTIVDATVFWQNNLPQQIKEHSSPSAEGSVSVLGD